MSNLTQQDLQNRIEAIVEDHASNLNFFSGPFGLLRNRDMKISDFPMIFVQQLPGGGDLGTGSATYSFQVSALMKTTTRASSVDKAFRQTENWNNEILNRYIQLHRIDGSIVISNRQRVEPGVLKSNAVGIVKDIAITVKAPFGSTSFPSK